MAAGQIALPEALRDEADLVIKFGPSLAAIVAVALSGTSLQRRSLWESASRIHVRPEWYIGAVLLPVILMATTALIHDISSIEIGSASRAFAQTGVVALFLGGGLGEELGWRGYLYPRLAARHGFLAGVIGTGIVWSAWHVPMFLIGAGPGVPLGSIVLVALAGSVIMGWLYDRTGGSVPVCAVFHAAVNAGATTLVMQAPPDQLAAVVWIYTAGFGVASLMVLGWTFFRSPA